MSHESSAAHGVESPALTPPDAEWLEYDDATRPVERRKTMLTKHALLLERSMEPSNEAGVRFREPADDDGNPGRTKLTLDPDRWQEMGEPDVVTVAVEPEDSLNA
jgi:hypothetical protein